MNKQPQPSVEAIRELIHQQSFIYEPVEPVEPQTPVLPPTFHTNVLKRLMNRLSHQ